MARLKSRLLHYPMNNPLFVTERTGVLAVTQGRVLELCFETEKNVHYYSPWVTDLTIVSLEGAPAESSHATNDRGLRVEKVFVGSDAIRLPFEDAVFDWVVSTLVLCRTKHTEEILSEARRVLKPAGRFVFLDHGRSENPSLGRWQHRLRNLWLEYGGCDVDREIDQLIAGAGFHIEKLDRFEFGRPKFLSAMYRGIARP